MLRPLILLKKHIDFIKKMDLNFIKLHLTQMANIIFYQIKNEKYQSN